ncbi:glucose/sorbosone dehydrogenase [Halovivax ruber XH-70]|uniref:Glucose/sorbosone dehydrogenase n=1 Tax=Halovivax ruber (strain DSM 18193 / JCM 13892 / XH-70) TaxID=797302 RepID=L0IGU4_HALRX|nr:PQQ-dependent sugar dehydrogenase [Halovivax ruber]AGB17202.1 glucose/sorbosone dehydrogenase [Halovivax ruber XH-70]
MVPHTGRRRFLTCAAVGAATGLAGCAGEFSLDTTDSDAVPTEVESVPEAVGLETVVDGLDAPLAVSFVPDAASRYVAERDGRILRHGSDGLQDDPVLDLRETVEPEGEKGLLGMAVHPNFADNRRLFVRYSGPLREGMPADYSHTFVLAEFEVTADGTRAPRDTERRILEIPEPRDLHNGGDLAFGPDGFLYVSVGDSGAAPEEGWHGPGGGGNGQDVTENLLGSILRLDVDEPSSGNRNAADDGRGGQDGRGYAIPDDNPLVGRDGLDEHFAWGFRNPWRLSFDGDDLYVADVGQSSYEEVNLVENGGNYGWNVKEGTHCFKAEDCPDETPDHVRGGEPLVDPIIEYPHEGGSVSGVSVMGGYVYRGSALPDLHERYVFGDFIPDGRLFVATPSDNDDELWSTAAIELDDAGKLTRILSFGRDDRGEVYVLGTGSEDGGLFRIVPAV